MLILLAVDRGMSLRSSSGKEEGERRARHIILVKIEEQKGRLVCVGARVVFEQPRTTLTSNHKGYEPKSVLLKYAEIVLFSGRRAHRFPST